jgi:hypothetical protein
VTLSPTLACGEDRAPGHTSFLKQGLERNGQAPGERCRDFGLRSIDQNSEKVPLR